MGAMRRAVRSKKCAVVRRGEGREVRDPSAFSARSSLELGATLVEIFLQFMQAKQCLVSLSGQA
jgi:hypothetical protein